MLEPYRRGVLEAFARRVETRGRDRLRTVLAVGANDDEVAWLAARGFSVRSVPRLAQHCVSEHSLDGLWLGDAASATDAEYEPLLREGFGLLHHGFVGLPVAPEDIYRRYHLELLLERANLRVVETTPGLVGWTKLVAPLLGAGGVVFNFEGKVLLTERADGQGWCIPGGVADADESPRETAVREMREETGLEVCVDSLLGIYSAYASTFGSRMVVMMFLCRIVGGEPRLSDETTNWGWFAEGELPEPLLPRHRIRLADAYALRRGKASPPFLRDDPTD